MKSKQQGFTLIEILLTVTIIGLLLSFGIPGYKDQIRKVNRSDGLISLTKCAYQMERYAIINGAPGYNGATIATPGGTCPSLSDEGFYSMAFSTGSITTTSYLIFALPLLPHEDLECQTLTLNNIGLKGIRPSPNVSDPPPSFTAEQCW